MQNINEILKSNNIEVSDEQAKAIEKQVLENYKTIADYTNAVSTRDSYKASLDSMQEGIKGLGAETFEDLKGQIETLSQELDSEKAARAKEAAESAFKSKVSDFLGDKRFINGITREHVVNSLIQSLSQDDSKGKSISELFDSLVKDESGNLIPNILVDEQKEKLEQGKSKFTTSISGSASGSGITKEDFFKMSIGERTDLKKNNPDVYYSIKKGK